MPAMANSPEFGDHELELVMGSVTGLRAWSLYEDGLRAVAHNYIWQTGENTATCHALRHTDECNVNTATTPTWAPPGFIMGRSCTCSTDVTGCDDLVGLDCGCGYWAYYADNDMRYGGSVVGIIAGYGRVLEGTLGFRCGKARIRALYVPTFEDIGITEDEYNSLQYWSWVELPNGTTRPMVDIDTQAIRKRLSDARDACDCWGMRPVRRETRIRLGEQYPGVEIYDDYAAMRDAWPVDQPPAKEDS